MRSGCTSSASSASAIAASAPARMGEGSGKRIPLGVPGAGRPLVLLLERIRQHGGVAAASRAEARASAAPTGFRFWGIVDDAPAPAATSPTSVWARSRTSSAILAAAPASTASAPPSSAIRVRGSCATGGPARPGRARRRRARAPGCPRHRSRRACRGAAELGGEPLLGDLGQQASRLGDPDQPAGCLEPERRRHSLLQQGARGHRRRPVLPGQDGARRHDAVGLGQHEQDRPVGDEHRRGVEDVLARGAAVHVARRVVSDRRGERADERLDRVAGGATVLEQLLEVEAGGVTRCLDLRRGRGRHEPGGGCCAHERALGREHASSHARPETASQAGRDEERLERRHAAIVVGHGGGTLLGLDLVPVIGTVSWIFDMGVVYISPWSSEGEVARGTTVPENGPRWPARFAPHRVADILVPVVSILRRPRALGSHLARRLDLDQRPARDDHDHAGAVVDDADSDVLEGLRLHGARLGAGLLIATVLAVPIGIVLGSSELAGRAFRFRSSS